MKALTELSLAVFSMEDFNLIAEHYPSCLQIMRKKSFILNKLTENQALSKSQEKAYIQDEENNILIKKNSVFGSHSFKIENRKSIFDFHSFKLDSNQQSSNLIKELSDESKNLSKIYRYPRTSKILMINPNSEDFDKLDHALRVSEDNNDINGKKRRSKSQDINMQNKKKKRMGMILR